MYALHPVWSYWLHRLSLFVYYIILYFDTSLGRLALFWRIATLMLLSKEKFEELKNELTYLKTTRRKEIADELEYAKSLGDLSENSEYHEARDNQAKIEKRIIDLEGIIKEARIMTHTKTDIINVGASVTIHKKNDALIRELMIVESEEADSATGKISVASPLGKALLGHKKGDEVSYESPAGTMTYIVEKVG